MTGEDEAFENSILNPVQPNEAVAEKAADTQQETPPIVSEQVQDILEEKPVLDTDAIDYSWGDPEPKQDQAEFTDDFNKNVEERFGQFGFKTGADIADFYSEAQRKVQELQNQLNELSKVQNPFQNDYQKKLFEFAKDYDGTNGSQIAEFERLQSFDVAKMTDKDKLREAYIFENREYGREKAARLFEVEYEDKYDTSALDPEFDARTIEKKNLLLEKDAFDANKKLVKAIDTFRPQAPQQVQQVDNTKLFEAVKQMSASVDTELKDFGVLDVRLDQDSVYRLGLAKEQVTKVGQLVKDHFSNPANYDDGGKELNGFTPKALAELMTKTLFHDQIVAAACKRAVHLSEMRKIKEKQPVGQRPLNPSVGLDRPVPKNDEEAFELSLMSQTPSKI